jgi:hypothetical protein
VPYSCFSLAQELFRYLYWTRTADVSSALFLTLRLCASAFKEPNMEIIEQLEKVKSETLKYFDLPEKDLQKKYGEDKWSVRYVLHHLADSESVLLYRLRRVISEPKQVIWFYDQEAWAKKLDYSTLPLEMSKNLYSISRDAIIYYARQHYEGSDQINFVHSTAGLSTLKSEFDKVVWHNQQHLSSIQKAL